ncbi:MAG: peptidoglycan bridge formation glycyltransferase FemA/FemB family protein [Verrucomicrobia bacterium]|nr:peptidoglycan bridge formation glycyltransferase FemA/FemB family protein [Verrucomicrobiota bacterium]
MDLQVVDPVQDHTWDSLVLSHPNYHFFHSTCWARVLCKTYGHRAVYLRCFQQGELKALVPMMDVRSFLTGCRGVCLPFTDFCSPLIFSDRDRVWPSVVATLTQVARERKWKYFEIRGGRALDPSTKPAAGYYGHRLDLGGSTEELFASLKSSARRAVRKAERSRLRVEVTRTRDALLDFYRLHAATRRRHGVPPQSVAFFLNIYDEIIRQNLGFVAVASMAACPVAAAVFLHFGKRAVYKFGASDHKFQEFRGSNLAMWEGIRFLTENGFETVHFGRTALENDGLRRFKQTWGAEEDRIEYLRFGPIAEAKAKTQATTSGVHRSVFGRLPVSLNCLAGTLIYPHLD